MPNAMTIVIGPNEPPIASPATKNPTSSDVRRRRGRCPRRCATCMSASKAPPAAPFATTSATPQTNTTHPPAAKAIRTPIGSGPTMSEAGKVDTEAVERDKRDTATRRANAESSRNHKEQARRDPGRLPERQRRDIREAREPDIEGRQAETGSVERGHTHTDQHGGWDEPEDLLRRSRDRMVMDPARGCKRRLAGEMPPRFSTRCNQHRSHGEV